MLRPLKQKVESSGAPVVPANSGPETYEVCCHHCDVSFPIGTKRCVHCGQRTGTPPMFLQQLTGDSVTDFGQPRDFSQTESSPVRPIDFPDEDDESEERGGSMARMIGNLSWILLFVAITVYRACAG